MLKSLLARAGNRRCPGVALVAGLAALAVAVPSAGAATAVTERVSVAADGAEATGMSVSAALSLDGRFVAFSSRGANLVAGDTGSGFDVFVRDRLTGGIELVSVASDGISSDTGGQAPAISADGRFVAFRSGSRKLVAGDTNGSYDAFVRDRETGVTERLSVSSSGAEGNAGAWEASISGDGRFAAFLSLSSNLVAGDTNGAYDVFVRDRQRGTTERVSVGVAGAEANGHSGGSAISADGRFVAFGSAASNLVAGDTNGTFDVFVYDRQSATTERIAMDGYGGAISADGRFVAYYSSASNPGAGDANPPYELFVRDRQSGATERVSVAVDGGQANGSSSWAALSADGRFVAFQSYASNLVGGDDNGAPDVFVRDRQAASTELVSVGFAGFAANGPGYAPAISGDGRLIAFSSYASNLVMGDTNGTFDVFVRDRDSERDEEHCTIEGTAGDDVLSGTAGNDVICGLGGADRISGGGGHDLLRGGLGDDQLYGGLGRDWLDGGLDRDHLTGGSGADTLSGGPGTDRASYWVRTAAVMVTIGDGANDGPAGERDDVKGDVEQLAGGRGNDTLTGDGADNRLSGNGGADRLIGGGGRDELIGGDGDDSLDARDGTRDSVNCGNGLDRVLSDPVDSLSATCDNR